MPGNRVEKLEAKVSKLESTVDGLTQELLEAKERIRDLEAELEPEPADGAQFRQADPEEVERAADEADAEEFDEGEQVEAGKDDAPETEDDTAETESGDDIIIA